MLQRTRPRLQRAPETALSTAGGSTAPIAAPRSACTPALKCQHGLTMLLVTGRDTSDVDPCARYAGPSARNRRGSRVWSPQRARGVRDGRNAGVGRSPSPAQGQAHTGGRLPRRVTPLGHLLGDCGAKTRPQLDLASLDVDERPAAVELRLQCPLRRCEARRPVGSEHRLESWEHARRDANADEAVPLRA